MAEKNPKELGKFEIVVPARDLLDAVIVSSDAYSKKPMTDEKAKNMRLVLGFLNSYLKAFNMKLGFFKLTSIPKKVKTVKKYTKEL
jgi:hypothetical protein